MSDDLRVLLIDPDDADQTLAATLLRGRFAAAGIETIATAASLATSLARGGFDVVVAEYHIPWIEGPALLDAIKAVRPGVSVVFLTSADNTEHAVAVMRAGAADYVVKTSRGFLRLPTAVADAMLEAEATSPIARPSHEAAGHLAGLQASANAATDVAASDTHLARLERINTDLRGLIAQTAHELDAPLRMVARHVRAVGEHRNALDAEGRRSLDLALAGVSRMHELLDDLGAYARIEADVLNCETFDCNALVDVLAQQLSARLCEDRVRIRRDKLPTVLAERSQLTQVFENLLSNALKFQTETPASVEITARAVGEEWLFSVRDHGIGVEHELADSIFIIFKRLRPDYPGTGVGLAICKRVVERHGGRIWVESQNGEGSTFHFTLPKNPVRAATPSQAVASLDGARSAT